MSTNPTDYDRNLDRENAELSRLIAETQKLVAEAGKLQREAIKMQLESGKIKIETLLYPLVAGASLVGATAAIVKIFF